jgi:hypothetical protein
MNIADTQMRPAYIVFRTGERRIARVIKIDGVVYYRARSARSWRLNWTQLQKLPSGAAVFPSEKVWANQGKELTKLYWVGHNGKEIEIVEKAPDGTMWCDGRMTRQREERCYKTMRAAKKAAAVILDKNAERVAKELKALRAKARRMRQVEP